MKIFQVGYQTKSLMGNKSRGIPCQTYEYINALSEEHAFDVAERFIKKYDKYAHDFKILKDCGTGDWFEKMHCLKPNFLTL